ncbi:hypothetical protein I8H89_01790 [Candidatus Saccharibacteria bacterium]|nr:hypothetical protein [Candidatus Saccharibacteria bacterium]
MECPHFEHHEVPPLDKQHLLGRQLISSSVRHDAHLLHETLERPNTHQMPLLVLDHVTDHFLQERGDRAISKPNSDDLAFAKAFLLHGIMDTFYLYENAAAGYEGGKLQETLSHPATIASVAHLAKHDEIAFNSLRDDPLAYRAVVRSGIETMNDEPLAKNGGCPEISELTSSGQPEAIPTKLFGRFVLWTGQLYIAAAKTNEVS